MMTVLHELTGIDVPEHDYPLLATIDAAERYIAERQASALEGHR